MFSNSLFLCGLFHLFMVYAYGYPPAMPTIGQFVGGEIREKRSLPSTVDPTTAENNSDEESDRNIAGSTKDSFPKENNSKEDKEEEAKNRDKNITPPLPPQVPLSPVKNGGFISPVMNRIQVKQTVGGTGASILIANGHDGGRQRPKRCVPEGQFIEEQEEGGFAEEPMDSTPFTSPFQSQQRRRRETHVNMTMNVFNIEQRVGGSNASILIQNAAAHGVTDEGNGGLSGIPPAWQTSDGEQDEEDEMLRFERSVIGTPETHDHPLEEEEDELGNATTSHALEVEDKEEKEEMAGHDEALDEPEIGAPKIKNGHFNGFTIRQHVAGSDATIAIRNRYKRDVADLEEKEKEAVAEEEKLEEAEALEKEEHEGIDGELPSIAHGNGVSNSFSVHQNVGGSDARIMISNRYKRQLDEIMDGGNDYQLPDNKEEHPSSVEHGIEQGPLISSIDHEKNVFEKEHQHDYSHEQANLLPSDGTNAVEDAGKLPQNECPFRESPFEIGTVGFEEPTPSTIPSSMIAEPSLEPAPIPAALNNGVKNEFSVRQSVGGSQGTVMIKNDQNRRRRRTTNIDLVQERKEHLQNPSEQRTHKGEDFVLDEPLPNGSRIVIKQKHTPKNGNHFDEETNIVLTSSNNNRKKRDTLEEELEEAEHMDGTHHDQEGIDENPELQKKEALEEEKEETAEHIDGHREDETSPFRHGGISNTFDIHQTVGGSGATIAIQNERQG